uniref:Uncharacterized protein n=1 Tax=Glossina pallidipes TaxID=7398 RepID=A0A1B0AAG3_GLOPL
MGLLTVFPSERAAASRPVETTSLDFSSPLYTAAEDSRTVRAVHVHMITKSCINGFRKFIARRGAPAVTASNNAKAFKRVDVELRKLEKLLKYSEVQNMAAK